MLTALQLEQRAEEARAAAEQMRDPVARRMMMNLVSSYERLAMREASEAPPPAHRHGRNDTV